MMSCERAVSTSTMTKTTRFVTGETHSISYPFFHVRATCHLSCVQESAFGVVFINDDQKLSVDDHDKSFRPTTSSGRQSTQHQAQIMKLDA